MTDKDILARIKEEMRAELCEYANKEIDKLVHKFACEMGKHKAELISAMLNRIEILVAENSYTKDMVFQINIKGGEAK